MAQVSVEYVAIDITFLATDPGKYELTLSIVNFYYHTFKFFSFLDNCFKIKEEKVENKKIKKASYENTFINCWISFEKIKFHEIYNFN